ncbi:hypothetical protein B0T10DRAFT_301183 [Thelonectria olida]|uniref:Uncharacterized protein n=1 Tax=Thelonectria olida TaxID=1576542 RepID=A0A9P8W526_9HYPO|nr:hypothetical protein B0T10DRAFT_301183 [Thelonectria olida]
MGKSLMDRIQAKLELFRLEQRYTRRRHRRSTFVSNAVYVDGEYVYQTPNSTGSSTGSSNVNALHGEKAVVTTTAVIPGPMPESIDESPAPVDRERKRLNRFSSIPHFGGSYNSGNDMPSIKERRSSMIR